MTPLQRLSILLTLMSGLTAAVPPATPIGGVAETAIAKAAPPLIYHLSPAVRERIRSSKIVDLPRAVRTDNWGPSCAHAALCNLFKMQGRPDLAEWWRQNHQGGIAIQRNDRIDSLEAALDRAGIPCRVGEDEEFLEWACRTRRGAVVPCVRGESFCAKCGKKHKLLHAINLVGLDRQHAYLIGVNDPEKIHQMDRQEFLADWKNAGGDALALMVGSPQPPKPWIVSNSKTPQTKE